MKYMKTYKVFENVINVDEDIDIFKSLIYENQYKFSGVSNKDKEKIFKFISDEFYNKTGIRVNFLFQYPWGVRYMIKYKIYKYHIAGSYDPPSRSIYVLFLTTRTYFKRLEDDFETAITNLLEILSHEFVHYYQDEKSDIEMKASYDGKKSYATTEYLKDKNEIMAIANGVYQVMRQYGLTKDEMLYFIKHPHEFSSGVINNKNFKNEIKGKPGIKQLFLIIKKLIKDGYFSIKHDKLKNSLNIGHFYEYLFSMDRRSRNRINKYVYQYIVSS